VDAAMSERQGMLIVMIWGLVLFAAGAMFVKLL
jgi:hypothetical protein